MASATERKQYREQREKPLRDWLEAIHARQQWWGNMPNAYHEHRVECWTFGGRSFLIVSMYAKDSASGGWDIYIPANDSLSIAETLNAAAEALGAIVRAQDNGPHQEPKVVSPATMKESNHG